MYLRLLLLLPLFLVACASADRKPTCITDPDSQELKCEQEKDKTERPMRGGPRGRP